MPKDMVCVKLGSTSYCWNFETCQLEIYTRITGSIFDCPKDIANELMRLVSERGKGEDK